MTSERPTRLQVDDDLLDLCRQIVAGLDGDITVFPTETRKELSQLPKPELDKFLDDLYDCVTQDSDDAVQNGTYYGGKWPTDSRYHFSTWESDFTFEHGHKLDISLNVRQVREIVRGTLKEVAVEDS
ncbi:MAG: hypothetical protein Q8L34_03335 [Candidatus Woesearchaeota archaeon]|nr:hypothetical protein [Candidatus Woesearchaeota archaeon]